jgi:hypothetical protein
MSFLRSTVALLGLSVLAGCQAAPAAAGADSSDTSNPPAAEIEDLPEVFYDEDVGFAHRVIEDYLAMSDSITAEGGWGQERMRDVVTPEWFPLEEEGFAHFRDARERTVGQSILESSQVQLARRTPEGVLDIGVITCVDTTRVLVVGPDDEDPPEAVMEWLGAGPLAEAAQEDWETIDGYFETSLARPGDRRAVVFWLVGESLDQLRIDHSEQWWGITPCG